MPIIKPRTPILQTSHPLNRGLVGAYLLTEGAGTVYDSSKYKADCRTFGGSGTINWTNGLSGSALKIPSGSNAGYINLGTPWNLNNLGPVTISAWVNMAIGGGNNGVIFSKTDNNTVNTGIIFGI